MEEKDSRDQRQKLTLKQNKREHRNVGVLGGGWKMTDYDSINLANPLCPMNVQSKKAETEHV